MRFGYVAISIAPFNQLFQLQDNDVYGWHEGAKQHRYINQVHVAAIISNTLWPALLTTSVAAEDRTKVVSNTIVKSLCNITCINEI